MVVKTWIPGGSSSGGFLRPLVELLTLAPIYLVGGAVFGQSAGMLPQLMKVDSYVRITMAEATWIASVPLLGLCISSLLTGPLSDKFGRIRMGQFALLFFGAGFAIMLVADRFLLLALGRLFTGLGMGCGGPASIHVSEVSPPAYRGMFLSSNQLFTSLGIVYMYTVGGYLPWRIAATVACLTSILGLVALFFLHESPVWLVRKNRIDAARKSLSRFEHSSGVEVKLKQLQETANTASVSKFTIGVFVESTVWKPFLMLFVMGMLQSGSGFYIIIFYAVNFLQELRFSIDALPVTIAIGVVRLLGMIVSSYLQRHLRRKIVGAMSGFSTAAIMLTIYAYMIFEKSVPLLHQNAWIPIGLFTAAVLTMTSGIFFLPISMIYEVYPLKVRGTMCMASMCMLSVAIFFVLKLYDTLIENLGIEGMIIVFAASSALFGLFSVTVLVETHNKTLEEVQRVFTGVTSQNAG